MHPSAWTPLLIGLLALAPARAQTPPMPAVPVNPFNSPAAIAERARLNALATADFQRMLAQLHLTEPALPPPETDPRRPAGTRPDPHYPRNWTDGVPGHTFVRSGWGSWTNYDLAKAGPGPLPDPLVLNDGARVTDAAAWWEKRRPEILADFQNEIYGRIPARTPKITWSVAESDDHALGDRAKFRRIVGHIDNSAFPAAAPEIDLRLYTPARAGGPVPVIVVIDGFGFGLGENPAGGPSVCDQVLAQGWGYATFNPRSVQADSGGGLDAGIIGLVNRGRPRRSGDWGAIAAWSWGLSRAIDYLETDRDVDARRLGVEGHSRFGKTALVAAAFDPRWAVAFASCSGEGGAKLHRHDFGESLDDVCSPGEYHWMAGNFLKYAGHWDRLPVDQHELIALIAPRPVFITGGTTDFWSDPVGEFEACVAAGPVYRLLGKKGVGQTQMPAPDEALIAGAIGFREHIGGHAELPDWPTFIQFAAKYLNAPAK